MRLYKTVVLFSLLFAFSPISSLSQKVSFKKRLELARKVDPIPINQVNRLKEVLTDLNETNYYDTIGLAQYYIAFRYNDRIKPKIPDSSIFYANNALNNFKKSNFYGQQFRNVTSYLIADLVSFGRFHEGINIFNQHNDSYTDLDQEVESIICQITSQAYEAIGDYTSGLNLLNNFINRIDITAIHNDYSSEIYLQKSILEYRLNLFQEALNSFNIGFAYRLEISIPGNIEGIANYINQEALILSALGKQEESIELYNTYLSKEIDVKDRFTLLSNAYNSFFDSKQYEVAAPYARQAFNLNNEFENTIQNCFISILNLSESYRMIKQLDSAIYYGNYGIQYLIDKQEKGSVVNLFMLKQYHNQVLNYMTLFDQTGHSSNLDSSRMLMNKVDSLLPTHLKNLLFEGSLLQNKLEIAEWYDTGVELANKLNSPELFIQYSDHTKALSSLSESIVNEEDIAHKDSIENELRLLITKESQLELIELNNSIDTNDSLTRFLLDNREMQRLLMTSLKGIEQNTQFKDQVNLSSFTDSDISILYYHVTDSVIYASHVNHNSINLMAIGKVDGISAEVSMFNEEIRNKNYKLERAKLLYNLLLKPFPNLSSKLIIIPDQELSLLPFEALITPDNSFLIEQHETSYALSMQQYINSKSLINQKVDYFQIVSPDYDNSFANTLSTTKGLTSLNKQFSFLAHTKNEVKFLEENLSAHSIQGLTISRDTFFEHLADADIFHFTGHAISLLGNDRLSFLALGGSGDQVEQDIFIREIAEHKTDACLVTLNACNTAAGKVLKGEGVYNLARSFFKAGAKSVVSGLWEIEDYSSSEITKSFYSYLKTGKTKSKALQLAKLDYLKNVKLDSKRNPYYWSGLILTGNTEPLFKKWNFGYYFGGFILILLLSLFVFKSRIPKVP